MFNAHFRTFDDNLAGGTIKYMNQMGEIFCNLKLLATILVFRFLIGIHNSKTDSDPLEIYLSRDAFVRKIAIFSIKIIFAFDKKSLFFSLLFLDRTVLVKKVITTYYCRKNHLDNCITLSKHRFAQLHIHKYNNDCVQN